MEHIFGGLVEFNTKEEFESFIETMDKESALNIIEAALTYGQQNGLYGFEESHTLYKCLTKLKEK